MGHAQGVGGAQLHPLQKQGAVRVEHTFRSAGGACGVAQGGSGVLIQHRPVVHGGAPIQKLFVAINLNVARQGNAGLVDAREYHRAHALHSV